MSFLISNCGSNEFGKAPGGKAGDQTGGEWKIKEWYNRPWDCVLRHQNANVRNLIASMAKAAAENDNIGYGQDTRYTFWEQLQAKGYDPAKISKACDADCSSGVAAIVKAVGYRLNISKLKYVSIYLFTGNMKEGLRNAGFEVLTGSKYVMGTDYLLPGDILLNEAHHTCIALGKGSKAVSSTQANAGKVGSCTVELKTFLVGAQDNQIRTIQRLLNALGYTDQQKKALAVDGELWEKTAYASTQFQKKQGMQNINFGTVAGLTWKLLLNSL